MELAVKGHSGYRIDIIRKGVDLYIYKRSANGAKASRLLKQAEKQKQALTYSHQGFQIPAILGIEQNEQGVSIKMPYVYSRNFMEYFDSAGFEQINYFIHTLQNFIEEEIASSTLQTISADIVRSKFLSVRQIIESNPHICQDDQLLSMLDKSQQLIFDIPKWELPIGTCHGDLTFSNILFTANTYYLIDFLDSFIESPLLDIVKLRQDSAHIWSAKLYTKPYDPIRLQIICKKIDDELDSYFRKYKWYADYYLPLQVLNLFRVLQYAKEQPIISDLQTEISRLLYAV